MESQAHPGAGTATATGGAVTHRIAVIPCDGIGKEVVPPAQRVLEGVGRAPGIAPSTNLDPEGNPSMFEPVHGSAPDIAGQGRANPLGQVWSGVMMLDHLGHPEAAVAVVGALESVLADTDVRTADLGGTATTEEVTDELLRALRTGAAAAG